MRNALKAIDRRIIALFISIVLLTALILMVGPDSVLERSKRFPLGTLVTISGLLAVNLFVVSFRFWRVLTHFGCPVPWAVASRASLAGHVAGLFIISLFGQVAGRQAVLRDWGVTPVVNAGLAAYERALLAGLSGSLAAMGIVYLIGKAAVDQFLGSLSINEILLTSFCAIALSLWLGIGRFEAALAGRLVSWQNGIRLIEIAALTFLGQLLVLMSFVLGILALAPQTDFISLFAAAAVISFAASMPITVNGWGVRELAAIFVLGHLSIPPADAIVISVMVGLLSTLVVLIVAPFSACNTPEERPTVVVSITVHSIVELEQAAAWAVGMMTAVTVFFQAHIILPGGVANLNLADPFAILALAAVSLQLVFSRRLPAWQPLGLNLALSMLSIMLVVGFVRGYLQIGVTQWALGGRIVGWLVLLGYLSAGYLIVVNAGAHGMRRFAETTIATAAVVIVGQILLRLINHWSADFGVAPSLNFEGYAGNRNAFAFQALVALSMLLGYSLVYVRKPRHGLRAIAIPVLLGIVLLGIAFSASRAGGVVAVILLAAAWLGGIADRGLIVRGTLVALALWVFIVVGENTVWESSVLQSPISAEESNAERWLLATHAFELWMHSPAIGIGLGVFFAKSESWLGHSQVVHSTPLWILTEFGFLGFAVCGYLFFVLFRHLRQTKCKRPGDRALALLLLAFLIFSQAHEIFYQRIFWLALGVLLAQPFANRRFLSGVKAPG